MNLHNIIKKKNNHTEQKLNEITTKYIQERSISTNIYTDVASFSEDSKGIGIFFENDNLNYHYRIRENIPINTLEAIAIFEAVKLIISKHLKKATIFTDWPWQRARS